MSDPFLGEIRIFAGSSASPPRYWAFCSGQHLPISQNQALFALIGVTYGGDGISYFMLPNLNGRVPIGADQGPSLSPYKLGDAGGVEQVTLAPTQLPQHTHAIMASHDTASSSQSGPIVTFATVADPALLYDDLSKDSGTDANFSGAAIQSAGGSAPHDNYMPTMALHYIIALAGIYPSFP